MNIYIVTIAGKNHYVRAEGKREATRIALDAITEETRMATHDELMHIIKHGHAIIGHESSASDTQDLPLHGDGMGVS